MNALVIANTQIRRDAAGRYCLNDLHQASGGHTRHKPGNWLMLGKTRELIEEIESQQGVLEIQQAPVQMVNDGFANSTYAIKELVYAYAYATWISAAFHLHVIRAYDSMVTAAQAAAAPVLLAGPQHRADQLVSAGRIFSAALRTARQLRLPVHQAFHAAADCAARHTGIQWGDELGIALDSSPAGAAAYADPEAAAVAAWAANRDQFTTAEAITGAGLGNPRDRALQMRVAVTLHSLHFHKRRIRANDQERRFVWLRSLVA